MNRNGNGYMSQKRATFVPQSNWSGCALTAAILAILQGTRIMGRGILLWLLGVPLPIILLLAMCSHR
jgi:hypothetical protein